MKQEKKTTTAVIAFLAVILLMMPLAVLAGSLEPSGLPTAGTMHSLEDIYQKLSTIEERLSAIEGKLQTSTTTTAPAGQRFVDNNNGTVTDTATGLIWLKTADPGYPQNWNTAVSIVNTLASGMAGLTDGSVAGQWRLPTKDELEQLGTDPPVHSYFNTWEGQCCPVNVTWTMPGAPFTGVHPHDYWACFDGYCRGADAWCLNMLDGYTKKNDLGNAAHYYWPVRTWELSVP